jgi:hypothetical protein
MQAPVETSVLVASRVEGRPLFHVNILQLLRTIRIMDKIIDREIKRSNFQIKTEAKNGPVIAEAGLYISL